MKIPLSLSRAFEDDYEALLRRFVLEQGLVPDAEAIDSVRFLTRSVVPHVQRMSRMFNRIELTPEGGEDGAAEAESGKPRKWVKKAADTATGLEPYWKDSSNPENFRLAYFLAFMPGNSARVASVITELARLGFRYPKLPAFRGIEWGAGPASGACGVALGAAHGDIGIPKNGNWALIEQDRQVLSLGEKWAGEYFAKLGYDWSVRPFHRKVDWTKPLLPSSAPKFHLWLSSYFLNEVELPVDELARRLVDHWEHHLEDEGLAILIEPALKLQSRRILELRSKLLEEFRSPKRRGTYQILLPCLGHQACGALAAESDWCHEEITWWRPKYLRKIDELAGLDRKSLPFSFLVVSKSKRPISELLPALEGSRASRLVSPPHSEGKDLEFFVCGEDGKRRARYRPEEKDGEIQRGSILLDADIRGDARAGRVERVKKVIE
jgi:hypothetical protein